MLVLSRKKDEKIRIGDNITITIIHTEQNKVRIGIDAPDDVRIDREEVRQRIEEQLANAA